MNINNFLSALPIMGKGMLGIFVITLVIIGSIIALDKIFSKKEDK